MVTSGELTKTQGARTKSFFGVMKSVSPADRQKFVERLEAEA